MWSPCCDGTSLPHGPTVVKRSREEYRGSRALNNSHDHLLDDVSRHRIFWYSMTLEQFIAWGRNKIAWLTRPMEEDEELSRDAANAIRECGDRAFDLNLPDAVVACQTSATMKAPAEAKAIIAAAVAEAMRRMPVNVQEQADYYDVHRAATYLGITVGAVRNLVSDGKLKCRNRAGNRYRFTKAELDEYRRNYSR